MHTRLLLLLTIFLGTTSAFAHAIGDDEISLFSPDGKPVAYIAEDLTIYTWSGVPVAYLNASDDRGTAYNIYGFNGKHIGWFSKGIVRDHEGNGACGVKGTINSPQIEPFKSFKTFKPFKSFKEFAPLRPMFSNVWGDTPCFLLLRSGADE